MDRTTAITLRWMVCGAMGIDPLPLPGHGLCLFAASRRQPPFELVAALCCSEGVISHSAQTQIHAGLHRRNALSGT